MNNYLSAEITVFQQKMGGYLTLFNYRMMNLCVKAEPAALMPATITLDGTYNLEETATIERPDDYHFKITPKNQNNLQAVIEGIFEVHPEFKMEEKTEKNIVNEDERYVFYTMPDVDKDRRDLLNETSKAFHKECLARLDTEFAKQSGTFVELLTNVPVEEANEAHEAIKEIYDNSKDEADQLLKAKLSEIEDGYQRYLEQEAERANQAANEFDYSKGMRLNYEE
ncbi:MAG: ribosome recycling factor [Prevotella sp.]|nr:ribosome recycling factor [Prevotella sp.]